MQSYRPLQAQFVTLEVAALLLPAAMALILNISWIDGRIMSFLGLSCILVIAVALMVIVVLLPVRSYPPRIEPAKQ